MDTGCYGGSGLSESGPKNEKGIVDSSSSGACFKVVKSPRCKATRLGNGWYSALSEKHNRMYYFNSVTGQRAWTAPDIVSKKGANVANSNRERKRGNGKQQDVEAVNELRSSTTAPPSQLAHGWTQQFDEHYKRNYFFNRETGESTWTNPMLLKPGNGTDKNEQPKHSEGSTDQGVTTSADKEVNVLKDLDAEEGDEDREEDEDKDEQKEALGPEKTRVVLKARSDDDDNDDDHDNEKIQNAADSIVKTKQDGERDGRVSSDMSKSGDSSSNGNDESVFGLNESAVQRAIASALQGPNRRIFRAETEDSGYEGIDSGFDSELDSVDSSFLARRMSNDFTTYPRVLKKDKMVDHQAGNEHEKVHGHAAVESSSVMVPDSIRHKSDAKNTFGASYSRSKKGNNDDRVEVQDTAATLLPVKAMEHIMNEDEPDTFYSSLEQGEDDSGVQEITPLAEKQALKNDGSGSSNAKNSDGSGDNGAITDKSAVVAGQKDEKSDDLDSDENTDAEADNRVVPGGHVTDELNYSDMGFKEGDDGEENASVATRTVAVDGEQDDEVKEPVFFKNSSPLTHTEPPISPSTPPSPFEAAATLDAAARISTHESLHFNDGNVNFSIKKRISMLETEYLNNRSFVRLQRKNVKRLQNVSNEETPRQDVHDAQDNMGESEQVSELIPSHTRSFSLLKSAMDRFSNSTRVLETKRVDLSSSADTIWSEDEEDNIASISKNGTAGKSRSKGRKNHLVLAFRYEADSSECMFSSDGGTTMEAMEADWTCLSSHVQSLPRNSNIFTEPEGAVFTEIEDRDACFDLLEAEIERLQSSV